MVRLRIRGEGQPEWQPDLGAIRVPKGFWHHRDNRVNGVVQLDRLAEDILASTEISVPEIIAYDCDARTAGLIFGCGEIASASRLQTEDIQEVRADPRRRETLNGLASARRRHTRAGRDADAFENVATVFAPLLNSFFGQVERVTPGTVLVERFVNPNEPVRVRKREGAEQCALDYRKDGGVRTNPEGERQNRDETKTRRFPKLAKGEAKIVHWLVASQKNLGSARALACWFWRLAETSFSAARDKEIGRAHV